MPLDHEGLQHPLSVSMQADRLLLIGFGIAGLVIMTVNNLTSAKFFLLFSPIFMMYPSAHLVLSDSSSSLPSSDSKEY